LTFCIQGFPDIDESGDFAVLAAAPPESSSESQQRLDEAISADPTASMRKLETVTGIGRNRIKDLAAQFGWRLVKGGGWQK